MMARPSTVLFARFSLDYADHPKIQCLSDGAFRAHVEMILYARKYMTDGRIPKRFAKRFATESLSELLSNDEANPSLGEDEDGDYWLHGFTDMQETRDEIQTRRLVNTENGRRGGLARKRNAKRTASESLSEGSSENVAETETETETDNSIPKGMETPSRRAASGTRGARLPSGWQPAREEATMRAEAGHGREWLVDQLEQFHDYWAAQPGSKGVKANWESTWRNWLKKAKTFEAPRGNFRPAAVDPDGLTAADRAWQEPAPIPARLLEDPEDWQ